MFIYVSFIWLVYTNVRRRQAHCWPTSEMFSMLQWKIYSLERNTPSPSPLCNQPSQFWHVLRGSWRAWSRRTHCEWHADRCRIAFPARSRLPPWNDWHMGVHTANKTLLRFICIVAACHWFPACFCKPPRVPLQLFIPLKAQPTVGLGVIIYRLHKTLYTKFEVVVKTNLE